MLMLTNSKFWPWLITIPLIITGFAFSVFFTGTNSVYFAPGLLSLIAFACFAIFPNILKQLTLPRGGVAIMLGLYTLYVVLSTTWSTIPYLSTQFMFFFCIPAFIFIVMMQTDDMFKWARIHAAAILTVFAALAVWAMVQYIFMYDPRDKRIHHPMLNPNSLAGLFNMSLLAALALFVRAKKQLHVFASGTLLALLYAGLIVTQSRAGVIFEAISVITFLVVMRKFPNLNIKKLVAIAVIACAVPFVIDLIHTEALDKNITRWTDQSTHNSIKDRYALLSGTWEMVKANPWLGTGLSSFYFFYPRYRLPYDRSDGFFTHIDPLQFWAEMGVLAPILFYGVLLMVLLRTIKAVRSLSADSDLRLEIMAPFCGLLAILLHAHMTFHLYILAMLFPIAFLFSYWFAATEKALGPDRVVMPYDTKFRKALVLTFVFSVLILSSQWIVRSAWAVSLNNQAIPLLQKREYAEATDLLKKSETIGPTSFYQTDQLYAGMLIDILIQRNGRLSRMEQKAMFEEAILHLDKAQYYAEPFEKLRADRAKLYYMMPEELVPNGNEKAKELLLQAIKNNPMLWDARVGLSRIYIKQGYYQKAFDILNEGTVWPMPKGPAMVGIFVDMAKIQQQLGNTQKAQEFLQRANYWSRRFGQSRR